MSVNIDQIIRDGAVSNLSVEVHNRIFTITNCTFEAYKTNRAYTKLGDRVAEARGLLNEIEILLREINKMDGASK